MTDSTNQVPDINDQVVALLGRAYNLLSRSSFDGIQAGELAQASQTIQDVAKLGFAIQNGTVVIDLAENVVPLETARMAANPGYSCGEDEEADDE